MKAETLFSADLVQRTWWNSNHWAVLETASSPMARLSLNFETFEMRMSSTVIGGPGTTCLLYTSDAADE